MQLERSAEMERVLSESNAKEESIIEGGDHASTSGEDHSGGVANDSKDKAPSKFAALYHKEKDLREQKKALDIKENDVKGFDWNNASWEEKNAKLEELGIDYEEWTDHLAGSNETESEREWREMKEWKENEEARLEKQGKSLKAKENAAEETKYVNGLLSKVEAEKEKYELVSIHPQKEELLLHYAKDYANKYNEIPNEEELIQFTEDQILNDAKVFLRSKKLRDLLVSGGLDDAPRREAPVSPSEVEVSDRTLSNSYERHQTQERNHNESRGLESRDERIARLTNKFGI